MTRQREFRERNYDFDEPPYRERPPSNRHPPRRNEYYEDDYDDRRRYPPQRPYNRGRMETYHRRSPSFKNDLPERYATQRPGSNNYRYGRERTVPPRSRSVRPSAGQQGIPPLQAAKKSTNRKIFLFVYNLFFYTLTIGILLSSLMFAFSEKSDAAIFGYRFYQVLTNSMAPQPDSPSRGFYAGDIVLVKMTDGSKVKEGDIVTFQVGEGDRYLTHRMVERLDELNGEKGDYIVTKGDANNSKDPPISADRVYGKVAFVIPKMGSVLNFVQENLWLCLVCVLSTFGFFLVLKAYFLQPEPVRRSMNQTNYPRRV